MFELVIQSRIKSPPTRTGKIRKQRRQRVGVEGPRFVAEGKPHEDRLELDIGVVERHAFDRAFERRRIGDARSAGAVRRLRSDRDIGDLSDRDGARDRGEAAYGDAVEDEASSVSDKDYLLAVRIDSLRRAQIAERQLQFRIQCDAARTRWRDPCRGFALIGENILGNVHSDLTLDFVDRRSGCRAESRLNGSGHAFIRQHAIVSETLGEGRIRDRRRTEIVLRDISDGFAIGIHRNARLLARVVGLVSMAGLDVVVRNRQARMIDGVAIVRVAVFLANTRDHARDFVGSAGLAHCIQTLRKRIGLGCRAACCFGRIGTHPGIHDGFVDAVEQRGFLFVAAVSGVRRMLQFVGARRLEGRLV